jgi:PadR family transcriptional regulator PadR
MGKAADNLLGTMDLLVLRTLSSSESDSLHGFAITERIHQTSDEILRVEEGSLYPALHRMEESGWIKSKWGLSENNRRARFYSITTRGQRHLARLEQDWVTHVDAVKRVMKLA